VDASSRRESPEIFLRHTIDALALVERTDGRRFKRVLRHIRYVVHQKSHVAGQYDQRLAACVVDFERLNFPQGPAAALYVYAALLVHEATHAAIHHRRIPYKGETRERIERLCHTEEARFLRRINPQLGNRWLERAYDLDAYEAEWNLSWRQRLRTTWKRTRDANRSKRPGR
jgi:hypothetical protein